MNRIDMTNKNRFFRKKPPKLMFQFTYMYVVSMLAVILLFGLSLVVSMSIYLVQELKNDIAIVKKNIVLISKTSPEKWQYEMDDLLYPEFSRFNVEMKDYKSGFIAHSSGWENQIAGKTGEFRYFNYKSLVFIEHEGIFFKTHYEFAPHREMIIYVKLKSITSAVLLLTNLLLVTGAAMIIVGFGLIYLISKRNIRPILAITSSLNEIQSSTSNLSVGVPVPEKPKELIDLAKSLNMLLNQLEMQIEREKGFVSDASHELRTPLAAIRGHVNLIKRRGKAHPEILDQSLEALSQESERMQRLMNQLLIMARTEHTKVDLVNTNLSELVEETVKNYWTNEKNIKLNLEIEPNVFMRADIGQLSQIIIILLENAQKYTEAEGSIQVSLKDAVNFVVLNVKDTGIGIPANDLDKIFQRFYRVDKDRSRQTGGTGLGLAIAKQLVDAHGGHISVSSTVGEGSEFKVTLPK